MATAIRVRAFKSAAKYASEYKAAERAKVVAIRQAKKAGNFFVEEQPKVLLVVRIRGTSTVPPKVRTILNLFRLRQINNAVFIRANKASLNALKVIESYVTYGPANLKTVRDLLYKRGCANVKGNRIPIVDNNVIADNLKSADILCMEDLVHEIYTCGPNFKKANNFIWPFKLNSPALRSKVHYFSEGGDCGNRGRFINQFVESIL